MKYRQPNLVTSDIPHGALGEKLRFAGIEVDVGRRTVEYEGRSLDLRRREFDVLLILLKGNGRIFKRQEILTAINVNVAVSNQLVDIHLSRLRKKLRQAGAHHLEIQSVYGIGYRIVA